MTESVNNQQLSAADCDMRPALVDDIPAIVAIIETGRELLAAEGVDQWQNGAGPCPNAVASDILQGWGRVFTVCDEVAATAAIMLAAFQQYGLQPGPLLFENDPQLVWGMIASLYVGNVFLLLLNLPMAGVWVKLLLVPKPWLTRPPTPFSR